MGRQISKLSERPNDMCDARDLNADMIWCQISYNQIYIWPDGDLILASVAARTAIALRLAIASGEYTGALNCY